MDTAGEAGRVVCATGWEKYPCACAALCEGDKQPVAGDENSCEPSVFNDCVPLVPSDEVEQGDGGDVSGVQPSDDLFPGVSG
jgi:hypothetical protein